VIPLAPAPASPPSPGPAPEARLEPRLEAIYAEHFERVWRGLARLGVPASSIDDAVQDVFLVVHRRLAEFQGRSELKTWLYGIALRVAKDHRRGRTRHAVGMARLASLDAPAPFEDPLDSLERRQARDLVHEVLDSMEEPDREVLVLVELEGLSVREAATVLDVRIRTCQRRLRAARAAFDAALSLRSPASEESP
jgi:RNA polymerase sigma-70 factor (ECF subfamily)